MTVPPPDRTQTLAPRATPDRESEPAKSAPAAGTDDPERYEQVTEHARGGLGRVVRAVDKRLKRTVAVKELLRRDASHELLFMREALITARLEHPGIVPVHEAGYWPNGDPYYVMKLVEGRTLKELITEHESFRERLALLPHVIAVADAVGYAHSEGVIHRDLKPSNVIVGAFGETIVVDWGLARDRQRDIPEPPLADLAPMAGRVSTVSGKVVGTPAYMSPEQARGEPVDERGDVYAIGAVLYELLAGMPPHGDVTNADTAPKTLLELVIAGPPTHLCTLAHAVPSELATIVAKAMERDPRLRYPNATALAEDLRRYQTGKLVSAHSYTMWSLVRRKLAANRGVVGVAIASALALGAVGVESFRRVVTERNSAQLERDRADTARAEIEHRQRELVLLQAGTSLRKDPTAALAWLKQMYPEKAVARTPASDGEREQVRDIVDEAVADGVSKHVFRPGDWIYDSMFTADGNTVVSNVHDATVRAYDLKSGTMRTLGRAPSAPEQMVLSKDGKFAITGGAFGEVIAWPIEGGPPRTLVASGGRRVTQIVPSADGSRFRIDRDTGPPEVVSLTDSKVSTLGPEGTLHVTVAAEDWTKQVVRSSRNEISAITANGTRPLAHTERMIDHVSMSPSGDSVVFHDGITMWTVPFTGGKMRAIAKYDQPIEHVTWSPDRKTVAIVGHQYDIPLIDIATGTTIRTLRGHTDALYNVQFTRDGKSLLSASDDGTARMWSLADGTSTVMVGHDDDVTHARLSADESQVVTTSLDASVRVWPLPKAAIRVMTEGKPIDAMWLAGDAALVVTESAVAHWNLATGTRDQVFAWGPNDAVLGSPRASRDGKLLALPIAHSAVEVRRVDGPNMTLVGHTQTVFDAAFSDDDRWLYTSSNDGSIRRWDLETGDGRVLWDGALPVTTFGVAHDGTLIGSTANQSFSIDPDGTIHILGEGAKKGCLMTVRNEPVKDRLVIQRCDFSMAIVDHGKMTELEPSDAHHAPTFAVSLAVSKDGSQIAAPMNDRVIHVWSASTGALLTTLRGHSDLVYAIAFSPDGKQMASASYDKTIRVWDLASPRHRVVRGHAAAVRQVAWRSATQLVSGSDDGTLRVWDVPSMDLPAVEAVANELTGATSARIDESDRPTTQGS
jgi:WD40 repeat protein